MARPGEIVLVHTEFNFGKIRSFFAQSSECNKINPILILINVPKTSYLQSCCQLLVNGQGFTWWKKPPLARQ